MVAQAGELFKRSKWLSRFCCVVGTTAHLDEVAELVSQMECQPVGILLTE